MAKKVRRPVLPIYAIGAVWLLYALVGTLYRVSDFLICGGLSLAAFAVLSALFPSKTYEVPDEKAKEKAEKPKEEQKPKSTGNKEIDALIQERERAVGEMRRLNSSIEDPTISAQIDHLEEVTRKIIDQVVAQPAKLPQIRKFMNYYLPTTLKILNAYDRMDSAGIEGANITATKQKVENMMNTISAAFDKQLDSLYGEEALDISTDITVMENLLKQEGLSGGSTSAGGTDGPTLQL